MIQSALVALIKTVNGNTYSGPAPLKGALPYVTIDLESSFRNRHWSGGVTVTGIIESDFEIVVWAKRNSEAYSQGQQIVSILENYSGPMVGMDSPQTVYNVADLEVTAEQSGFDGETELYQYSIFITIKH